MFMSLRRLDLSVELARRDAEEQVSKRLACEGLDAGRGCCFSLKRNRIINGDSQSRRIPKLLLVKIRRHPAYDGSQFLEDRLADPGLGELHPWFAQVAAG
jgi:hypothetical protein